MWAVNPRYIYMSGQTFTDEQRRNIVSRLARATTLIVIDADGYAPVIPGNAKSAYFDLASAGTDGYRIREVCLSVWQARPPATPATAAMQPVDKTQIASYTYFVYDAGGIRPLTPKESWYVFRKLHGLPVNPTKTSYTAFNNSTVCSSDQIIPLMCERMATILADSTGPAYIFTKGGNDHLWFADLMFCPAYDLNDFGCPTTTALATRRNFELPVCKNHRVTQVGTMHCPSAEVVYLLDWLLTYIRTANTQP